MKRWLWPGGVYTDMTSPWFSKMAALYELRECRVCTHMVANDRAWGRKPSKNDSNLCEVCDEMRVY